MKKIVFLLIILLIMLIGTNVYAKYVIENEITVAEVKIDSQIPKIELGNVYNDNIGYTKYAKKTNEVELQIKVLEKNIKENHFGKETVQIIVGNQHVNPEIYEIRKIGESTKMVLYEIKLKGLLGDGKLEIKVKEGAIIDKAEQKNEETTLDSDIEIDNTSPILSFLQEAKEEGKINAKLTSNEPIRNVNAWNITEDKMKLTKEFKNNVLYPLPVSDLAGNKVEVDINVTRATNISIQYGALNSESKWTFGYGNNEVVGNLTNSKYKTEGISLYYEGNIDRDFIQLQSYMHTYWGVGKQGICDGYETIYNHGYNPGENEFGTLLNAQLSYIDGKLSIYQGGYGVNRKGNKGIGSEKIPEEIANQYLFGISGLKLGLKDYSEYSIVYQIWTNESGWQKPASDAEETYYKKDKPISRYRMSLIPKTEKQYLIDDWSKDIGTNNIK